MNARPPGGTHMTDPFVANQFKKVHARLEELCIAQRRIECSLCDMAYKAFPGAGGIYSQSTTDNAACTAVSSGFTLTSTRSNPSSYQSLQQSNNPASACVSMPVATLPRQVSGAISAAVTGPAAQQADATTVGLLPTVGSDASLEGESNQEHKLLPWPEHVWFGDDMLRPKRSRSKRTQMKAAFTSTPTSYGRDASFCQSRTESGEMESRMIKLELSRFKPTLRCALPIHPHSKLRLIIDVLSMAILLYDSIQLPLALAFPMPAEGTLLRIAMFSAVFWTCEIFINAVSAVYVDDTLTKDVRTTVRHYFKYWFVLDFAIVTCDWTSVILSLVYGDGGGNGTNIVKSARLLKLGRILRILAVLRMGRFAQVYQYIVVLAMRQGRAAYIEFAVSISKLVLLILWFNHVGSCLWHALAFENPFGNEDTGRSWEDDTAVLSGVPWGYLYVFGFYWSVTAMFSGASVVLPHNSIEAVISIIFVIFGILLASSLISTLAALLIDFQMNERESTERMRTLRRFLKQHKISLSLSIAIQKQVIERMAVERRLSDQEVPVLNLVSANLRMELRHALCDTVLGAQDVLRALIDVDLGFAHDLVTSDALEIKAMNPGEVAFHSRESVSSAMTVVSGDLRYSAWSQTVQTNGVAVPKQKWICEAALWAAEWTSRGLLEATSASEVVGLSAMGLGNVAKTCLSVATVLRDVSVKFCMAIAKEQPECFGDLDVGLDMDSILFTLEYDSRTTLAMPVVAPLRDWHPNMRPHNLASVEEEVDSGSCLLRTDANGCATKITQVAILKLQRDDGTTLVKLPVDASGKLLNGKVALPSTTVMCGELPRDAIFRLIHEELPEFYGALTIDGIEVQATEKQPLTHKVRMKHIQTTCHATLDFPGLEDVDGTEETLMRVIDSEALSALLGAGGGIRRSIRKSPSNTPWSEAIGGSPRSAADLFHTDSAHVANKPQYGWMTAHAMDTLCRRKPHAVDAENKAAMFTNSFSLSATLGTFEVRSRPALEVEVTSEPQSPEHLAADTKKLSL